MSMMPMPSKPRRGLFGAPMMGSAPSVVPDLSEILAPSTAQSAPVPNMGVLAPTTHPEMQGASKQPSLGMQILGSVGGTLSQWAGGENFYAKNMAARQRALAEAAQYQRERADKFTDWKQQQDYQRANPMPSTAQPYRWEGNDGDVYELGPDGKPRKLFDDPTARYVPDGVGGLAAIPGTGAGGTAPTAPVGRLTPVGKLTPIGGALPGARPFR